MHEQGIGKGQHWTRLSNVQWVHDSSFSFGSDDLDSEEESFKRSWEEEQHTGNLIEKKCTVREVEKGREKKRKFFSNLLQLKRTKRGYFFVRHLFWFVRLPTPAVPACFEGKKIDHLRPHAWKETIIMHRNHTALEGRYVDVLQRIFTYFEGNKSITWGHMHGRKQ